MSRNKDIKFLKFLHSLEKRESENGLFVSDASMTIVEIRVKFLSLNNQVKPKKRKGV